MGASATDGYPMKLGYRSFRTSVASCITQARLDTTASLVIVPSSDATSPHVRPGIDSPRTYAFVKVLSSRFTRLMESLSKGTSVRSCSPNPAYTSSISRLEPIIRPTSPRSSFSLASNRISSPAARRVSCAALRRVISWSRCGSPELRGCRRSSARRCRPAPSLHETRCRRPRASACQEGVPGPVQAEWKDPLPYPSPKNSSAAGLR